MNTNYNEFKLGGRYKHSSKVNDNHKKILVEVFDKDNNQFIEVDIFDKDLLNISFVENELVVISGHIKSEVCYVNDEVNFLERLLVADKIMRKGN